MYVRRRPQELPAVVSRVRRDTAERSFLKQVSFVVELWDVAEVDACDRECSAPVECLECREHQCADRGEQDRRVEQFGGLLTRTAHARYAQLEREVTGAC